MNGMGRLTGKVALITGAGAGIGRATALLLAREGAATVLAELDPASGTGTLSAIQAAGGVASFVCTDVTESVSMLAAVAHAVDTFGRLDILHNNAGGSTTADGPVTDAPEEEFWRKIKLDLFGTWLGCRHAIPVMIQNGGGTIINMSSVCALVGTCGKDAYTAAKGGVAALTRSMAVEYAPHKIRVNALAPAATRTDRVMRLLEQDGVTGSILGGQLLGMVEPEDVAAAVLYLASDESRVVTGQVLPIDSGFTV